MTWGFGAWGSSPWGLAGLAESPQVERCYADTDRSILIEFVVPPLQQSEIGDGDALNPNTWAILSNNRTLLPILVTRIDQTTFQVRTLQLLDTWLEAVTISSATLKDAGGNLIAAFTISVPGAHVAPVSFGPTARYVDAQNPPFLLGQPAGQIQVMAGGDYANESGEELVKKLVLRFLSSSPGELTGLTEYGLGVRVQEPVSTADLVQMRIRTERGLLRWIPDAENVGVRLTLDGNQLQILVKVKLATGVATTVGATIAVGSGVQL